MKIKKKKKKKKNIKNECECFIRGSKHWETDDFDFIVSRSLEPLMKHEAQVFGMGS